MNIESSGIVINSLKSKPYLTNFGIPNLTISNIEKDGLIVNRNDLPFYPKNFVLNYSLCIVFYPWKNRIKNGNFALVKKNSNNNKIILSLIYYRKNNSVNLTVNKSTQNFTLSSSFRGNKIVLWLAESYDGNVTKASCNK